MLISHLLDVLSMTVATSQLFGVFTPLELPFALPPGFYGLNWDYNVCHEFTSLHSLPFINGINGHQIDEQDFGIFLTSYGLHEAV